jgi:hypothetical protein
MSCPRAHPGPLPQGEGEFSADGLMRRMVTTVQGFNAQTFWGILSGLSVCGCAGSPDFNGAPLEMGGT